MSSPVNNISNAENVDQKLQRIVNHMSQSIAMMEVESYAVNYSSCCKAFQDSKFATATNIICEFKQNTTEWLHERQFRITASRIYEIFTYRGKNWPEKAKRYFFPKNVTVPAMLHGITNEAKARKHFAEETGFVVEEVGMLVPHNNPWIGCSPDGIIMGNEDTPYAILEIKCPYSGKQFTLIIHSDTLLKCMFILFRQGR